MTFREKLNAAIARNNSLVCVGLDSDVAKLPLHLNGDQFLFNKEIIDATHDVVCAYKPNSAFYEARGADGVNDLKKTCHYLREKHPDIPIVLDAKRGDIGNTNNGYVSFAFDWLAADAITLHPYLGREAIQPFLDRADKFSFILCLTSNPGAGELQNLTVVKGTNNTSGVASDDLPEGDNTNTSDGVRTHFCEAEKSARPLYQMVAARIAKNWNENDNCGLVVGATYPEEIHIVRRLVGDMPLLVPGIGAQGGDIEKTVKNGLDSHGAGMIINSSRAIIFATKDEGFADKARKQTQQLRDQINQYR